MLQWHEHLSYGQYGFCVYGHTTLSTKAYVAINAGAILALKGCVLEAGGLVRDGGYPRNTCRGNGRKKLTSQFRRRRFYLVLIKVLTPFGPVFRPSDSM